MRKQDSERIRIMKEIAAMPRLEREFLEFLDACVSESEAQKDLENAEITLKIEGGMEPLEERFLERA